MSTKSQRSKASDMVDAREHLWYRQALVLSREELILEMIDLGAKVSEEVIIVVADNETDVLGHQMMQDIGAPTEGVTVSALRREDLVRLIKGRAPRNIVRNLETPDPGRLRVLCLARHGRMLTSGQVHTVNGERHFTWAFEVLGMHRPDLIQEYLDTMHAQIMEEREKKKQAIREQN